MKGKLYQIDYVVGKSRSVEGAESIRDRVNETLTAVNSKQHARVTRIANKQGSYGWRVNVVSEVAE